MYVGITVFTSFMLGPTNTCSSFFPLPFSFLLADTVVGCTKSEEIDVHDALSMISQFCGSSVSSGFSGPELLWFRVCPSPEDAVLGRQTVCVTAFLLSIEEWKEAKET